MAAGGALLGVFVDIVALFVILSIRPCTSNAFESFASIAACDPAGLVSISPCWGSGGFPNVLSSATAADFWSGILSTLIAGSLAILLALMGTDNPIGGVGRSIHN